MSAPAISVEGLRKSFPGTKKGSPPKLVLDDLGLTVQPGTVHALLGPNGAGKTTVVHILTTYLRPDAGRAVVAGHDVVADPDGVRGAIGVTGQFSAVDWLLTGRENLRLMADLNHLGKAEGRRVVEGLLERFELVDAADKPAATYSGGMKRRLDLAMTLVAKPRVVFLDEPTTGLDPRSRRTMWEFTRELVAAGTTILLTTQYLDEADELADRVTVLDAGRVVADGTAAELKRRVPGGRIDVAFTDRDGLDAAARALRVPAQDGLTLRLPHDGGVRSLRAVVEALDDAAVDVATLTVKASDLDDVFFALTGHAAEPSESGEPVGSAEYAESAEAAEAAAQAAEVTARHTAKAALPTQESPR
ncbi:daunorubicin resistance protein DrrA family ABC transporter ATP-binding protein [Catenulispora yoronensis]|uniref:Daunorubicin resistance protein DrrA family ABC transporter ATP-binding protein n=1 Tax=Catenulispora yoronensis TaxID=450799 RepID=A0ABN2V6G1_9ACTN